MINEHCDDGERNLRCGICLKPTDETVEHNIDGRIVHICVHCSELEKKIFNHPIKNC